jgi:hypothetical protein
MLSSMLHAKQTKSKVRKTKEIHSSEGTYICARGYIPLFSVGELPYPISEAVNGQYHSREWSITGLQYHVFSSKFDLNSVLSVSVIKRFVRVLASPACTLRAYWQGLKNITTYEY